MKGKPKYKLEDKVKFTIDNITYEGKVYIIDKYGTWDNPVDVSYDIMVDNYNDSGPCLFKHITEKLVEKV